MTHNLEETKKLLEEEFYMEFCHSEESGIKFSNRDQGEDANKWLTTALQRVEEATREEERERTLRIMKSRLLPEVMKNSPGAHGNHVIIDLIEALSPTESDKTASV